MPGAGRLEDGTHSVRALNKCPSSTRGGQTSPVQRFPSHPPDTNRHHDPSSVSKSTQHSIRILCVSDIISHPFIRTLDRRSPAINSPATQPVPRLLPALSVRTKQLEADLQGTVHRRDFGTNGLWSLDWGTCRPSGPTADRVEPKSLVQSSPGTASPEDWRRFFWHFWWAGPPNP